MQAFICLSAFSNNMKNDWILDSGASKHMCNNYDLFINKRNTNIKFITAVNNSKLPVFFEGDILLKTNKGFKIILKNALFIPYLSINLISISCIIKNDCNVNFTKNECFVTNKNNMVILSGNLTVNGIYKMKFYENNINNRANLSINLN